MTNPRAHTVMPDDVGPFDDDGIEADPQDVVSGDLPPRATTDDRSGEVPMLGPLPSAPPDQSTVITLPDIDPAPPRHPFDLQRLPRVVNGVVVPAKSVKAGYKDDQGIRRRPAVEFWPASNVGAVRPTAGAVVAYLRTGKPVFLWIGTDAGERDQALASVLKGLKH